MRNQIISALIVFTLLLATIKSKIAAPEQIPDSELEFGVDDFGKGHIDRPADSR